MYNSNTDSGKSGIVRLVGAGCEAGQITVRGLEALREADVIVYDDLLDRKLLSEARKGCELIDVGKRWGAHKKEQDEIHDILISRAGQGKNVVRLKGGDPTVFGRGGEEFLALREAGIRCEMVPGVSSCIAGPEHMGISITHRGMASSFTVVTGHSGKETAEDFQTLAALKGTLIFLMGLRKAEEIAEGLMRAGKAPETPVSVLSCVYREGEKRLDGTLGSLTDLAKYAEAPAIIVVGKMAGLHLRSEVPDAAAQESAQSAQPGDPKSGVHKSALVVGTRSFTDKMASLLNKDGLRTVKYPCLGIVPQPGEIPANEIIANYKWIVFTSANGVRIFWEEMKRRRTDLRRFTHLKFACIGPGTAKELEERFLLKADLLPKEYTTEGLAQALGYAVGPGQEVLILRAAEGNILLTKALECEKIPYRDCRIYRTQYFAPEIEADPEIEAGLESFDYVLFASAGGVRAFLKENTLPESVIPVCIGEKTGEELEILAGRRGVIARESTAEGIRRTIRDLSSHSYDNQK